MISTEENKKMADPYLQALDSLFEKLKSTNSKNTIDFEGLKMVVMFVVIIYN